MKHEMSITALAVSAELDEERDPKSKAEKLLCWFVVSLIRARVIWEEGTATKKMLPYAFDPICNARHESP